MSVSLRQVSVMAAFGALLMPFAVSQAELKVDDKGFVTLQLGEEAWTGYPGITGIDMMKVYGDPSQPGVYVIRARFKPGVMTMPHFHREDRMATVLKGTWWTGTGTEFKPDSTHPVRPGGYMMHPAGEAHFDGAKKEEVVLQLVGVGPSGTTFVRPELGPTSSGND